MALNEVEDYYYQDTELQNYTETGVKRIINHIIFQNNLKFLLVHFLYFEKIFSGFFLDGHSDKTEIHTHVSLDEFTPHSDMGKILKNILNACFSCKCKKGRSEN